MELTDRNGQKRLELELCFEGMGGLKKKEEHSTHEKQTMPGTEKEILLESAGRTRETMDLEQRFCVGG